MKYVIIPFGRFILVLLSFLMFTVTTFLCIFIALWDFNLDSFRENWYDYTKWFFGPSKFTRYILGPNIEVYKTPWHFLIGRKTWVVNPDYQAPLHKK